MVDVDDDLIVRRDIHTCGRVGRNALKSEIAARANRYWSTDLNRNWTEI